MQLTQPFIAVDLDGTLCDSHELGALCHANGVFDPETFYAGIKDVKVFRPMVSLIHSLTLGGYAWEIWTARQEQRGRGVTEQWLYNNSLHPRAVRMNTHGDNWISSPDVKREFLKTYGTPRMLFDDDEATIKMFKDSGINTFKVSIPNAT